MQTYVVNFVEGIYFTFGTPILHSTINIFQKKRKNWGNSKNQHWQWKHRLLVPSLILSLRKRSANRLINSVVSSAIACSGLMYLRVGSPPKSIRYPCDRLRLRSLKNTLRFASPAIAIMRCCRVSQDWLWNIRHDCRKLTWMRLKRNIFAPVFLKFSSKKSYRFEKKLDTLVIWNPFSLWILSSEDSRKVVERITIESAINIAVREVTVLLLASHWEGCASTLAKVAFPANRDMST